MPAGFKADVAFSFKGRAFLADLMRGVLVCNLREVLSDDDRVVFGFIDLPPECRSDLDISQPRMFRTMRCVGDSIKLVSIDGYLDNPRALAHRKVTMWTLKLDLRKWVKDGEISVRSLWGQKQFKKARLPTHTPPMNPILSSQEDHVLYFMLDDYYNDEKNVSHTHGQYTLRVLQTSPFLGTSCSARPRWFRFLQISLWRPGPW